MKSCRLRNRSERGERGAETWGFPAAAALSEVQDRVRLIRVCDIMCEKGESRERALSSSHWTTQSPAGADLPYDLQRSRSRGAGPGKNQPSRDAGRTISVRRSGDAQLVAGDSAFAER